MNCECNDKPIDVVIARELQGRTVGRMELAFDWRISILVTNVR